MSIGLCCVSMPAFSKMLSHHLPPYEKIISWLISRNLPTKSTKTSHSSSWKVSTLKKKLLLSDKVKTPNGSRESNLDIEGNNASLIYANAPSSPDEQGLIEKPVRTFIKGGESNVTKDNGIHCEIESQRSQVPMNDKLVGMCQNSGSIGV